MHLKVLDAIKNGDPERAKFLLDMSVDGAIITLHDFGRESSLSGVNTKMLEAGMEYRQANPSTRQWQGIDRSAVVQEIEAIVAARTRK